MAAAFFFVVVVFVAAVVVAFVPPAVFVQDGDEGEKVELIFCAFRLCSGKPQMPTAIATYLPTYLLMYSYILHGGRICSGNRVLDGIIETCQMNQLVPLYIL